MRGEERCAAVDDAAAVGFEGVGRVVEADVKDDSDEEVGHPVEDVFDEGVVDGAAASDEAGAEDAIDAAVEFFEVTDDVAAIVGFVGHHDDDGVAGVVAEAALDGAAEAVEGGVLYGFEDGEFCREFGEDFPGVVGTAVIDDDDFVGNVVEAEFEVEVLDGRGDAPLLIARGDDDGEKVEGLGVGHCGNDLRFQFTRGRGRANRGFARRNSRSLPRFSRGSLRATSSRSGWRGCCPG